MKKIFFGLSIVFLVTTIAYGRPVRLWQPDELYKKSDVVVVAVVKEVGNTGKTSEIQLGDNNPKLKSIERVAKLQVLHVIKGKASDQCKLKYETLDPESTVAIINGPGRIHLAKGKVYLLYLKKTSEEDSFLGVLTGDFDDNQAAKEIKIATPNKSDADDSPAPQSSLSKQIADHVERVGENDQLLLRDLPKFRQDLIQSIESGWEPPFIDDKNVKSRADYEKLSTPALAKECFKTPLWARLMLIYERPAYGIVRAGVVHNGFAVLYTRADFWDGIAAVYEDLARKLPKAKVERERMDILFNLQELGSALTYPPFREKLRGREETLLRANVVALKAVLGYTEEAKQQPKKPFWGAGVAYGLSCNVFALLKETNPEKYSQLLEQLKGIDLSFREPEPSQVEAYIQLLVSEADQSTATEESKSEHTGTRIAEPDAAANAGKSRR